MSIRFSRLLFAFTFVASLAAAVISPLFPAQQAKAVSGADWRSGRIMDASVFRDKNSMSTDAIQNFLNSKVPNCDTNGSKPSEYGGGTRAQYGAAHGAPAPYTCLRSYSQNGRTAAQIIKDTAMQYNLNPQVLLTLLQKEQNLVTDEWPWPVQYQKATGYACPDSAPCDSQYFGFTNQVQKAARMFQAIVDNDSSWYTPYGVGAQNIRYNPRTACGSSTVNVEGRSTSALYNYTPYQPNQAALNSLYGLGDDCSSYGNRNFWRLFNDWFGSTVEIRSVTDLPEAQRRIQTIEVNGQIYVFYYDNYESQLRMATQTTGWQFSVLDGSSEGGGGRIDASIGSDIAVTKIGTSIQLFYYDKTRGNLRHAWTDANGWHFENLDGDSGSVGGLNNDLGSGVTAMPYAGGIQLFYYDKTQGNLRHAWSTSGHGWKFESLDGERSSVSGRDGEVGTMAAVVDAGTSIQLYYYDITYGNLRHAWTDSNGWHFENLDGDSGSVGKREGVIGFNPAVTMLGSSIQLYYYDQSSGNLRHGWTDNTGWHFENLDGDTGSVGRWNGDLGINPSVTTLGSSLQVYYYDQTYGNLRHAWTDTAGWHFENLDGDTGSVAGRDGNIGVNSGVTTLGTSIQTYYYDRTSGRLRHGWTDANGWHFEDLGPTVVY